MGVQHTFGTAGATGGGWSAIPGALQPAYEERWAEPKWSWQARAPKTWKDRNRFVSLWSFGCCTEGGLGSGQDGSGPVGRSLPTASGYEPFSCDGEGTQSLNFFRGTCKDNSAVAVANAIVQAFRTDTDAFLGQVQGNNDGTYTLGVELGKATACYLVAYKAGSPDITGATVNTLLATNVDGT
jgi:hypothetical protein